MTILDALSSARQYLVSAATGQSEVKYHAAYFAPQKEIEIEVSGHWRGRRSDNECREVVGESLGDESPRACLLNAL